jgi:hypothetical protein
MLDRELKKGSAELIILIDPRTARVSRIREQ